MMTPEQTYSVRRGHDPEHVGEDVKSLFAGSSSAVVVAPFITKRGLLPLIDVLAPGGRLDVVTRWEPQEIRAGASDPMVIKDVEATGGSVRLLPRLHAKVYLAGGKALVGSANPTGPGLGFTRPANIEIIVPADPADPALARLFTLIDNLASHADLNYARQLADFAASLPESFPASPQPDGARAPHWIPLTMVPRQVMRCYFATADREDYRADLAAIAAPPGLSTDGFRTHVGLVLRQGLIGKIYRDCDGLQQWEGIERMLHLLDEAHLKTDEDPQKIWRRLLNWFRYYMGTTDGLNGGYRTNQ